MRLYSPRPAVLLRLELFPLLQPLAAVHKLVLFALPTAALVLALATLSGCAGESSKTVSRDTVRIALHGEPNGLDPHLQSEVISSTVLGNIYEGLVGFGPNMRLEPHLAESWSNPSDLVWRFRLRAGITFHDGRLLTVDDVLASIQRVQKHPKSQQAGLLVAVVEARKIDDRTLELRTDRPYPIMLNRLAFVSVVPQDAPSKITEPVGTGPYRFISWRNDQVMLEAVEEHWRVSTHPSKAEYYFVADSKLRGQGLLEGRFDLIDDLAPNDLNPVKASTAYRVESRNSLAVTFLQLDIASPPFDDVRVRRALSLAIDRRALVDQVFRGLAEPTVQMVGREVFGHIPTLRPETRDLEASRRLLREAGYDDGLEMELEVRAGREEPSFLVQHLAEAGFRVRLTERPWGEMYDRLLNRQTTHYLGAWVCTSGDAGDVLDRKLHSPDPDRGYGDANYNGSSSEQLDLLIKKSNTVLDMERRQTLLQQALELAAEQLNYVPLYSVHHSYGVADGLAWTARQDARVYAFEALWTATSAPPSREPG